MPIRQLVSGDVLVLHREPDGDWDFVQAPDYGASASRERAVLLDSVVTMRIPEHTWVRDPVDCPCRGVCPSHEDEGHFVISGWKTVSVPLDRCEFRRWITAENTSVWETFQDSDGTWQARRIE